MQLITTLVVACLLLSVHASSNGQTGTKQVFAHFMMGNTYGYNQAHFTTDIQDAINVGIDAFALNIGADQWEWDRISLVYAAAAELNFKLFISFDMNFFSSASVITSRITSVAGLSAQYKYNNKVFVSTFGGANVNMGYSSADAAWASIKTTLSNQGTPIFFVPNFAVNAYTIFTNNPSLDGAFSWGAWPNPTAGASGLTPGDNVYMSSAASASKIYMAPIAPWFFTHLSYKNYIYDTETLWYDRWQQLLSIAPHLIEVISWNDWGEAHYIGTIDSDPNDLPAGSQDYVYGFPHVKWQDILPYFISYYKNGVAPSITQDIVVYYHRPYLKSSVASADPYGQPYVSNQDTSQSSYTVTQIVQDKVYVITILTSAATIRVTSGGTTTNTNVPAGAYSFSTQMYSGTQTVTLLRNTVQLCTNTGSISVATNPVKYNYNAYVGGCKYTPSSSSTTTSSSSTTGGSTTSYVGCFWDLGDGTRDLPTQAPLPVNQVTITSCRRWCGTRFYTYSGLQYAQECFCGNSYGRFGRAGESECNMACTGNSQEICGAGNHNSVYQSANVGYIGCYVDDVNARDLPFQFASSSTNTIESCKAGCLANGYTYAGLQYGLECFCGNSYGRHGSAPNTDCVQPCTGDSTEYCGNGNRNSVYRSNA